MAGLAVTMEETPALYRDLGGRGLTSRVLLDEVDPTCDPLGDGNKLVIAPGLLAGTVAPCSGRLSVGAKSPLTGGIKESNAGGTVAQKLARLGIKAVIIEGKPAAGPYLLEINKRGARLVAAGEYRGMGNYALMGILRERYGPRCGFLTVGPAGEHGYALASIAVSDPEGRPSRHCGRGGMGAVLGARGIKVVVVDDSGCAGVDVADPDSFRRVSREWAQGLVKGRKILTDYGTANLVLPMNALGGLPTRNYQAGTFEQAGEISGERLQEVIIQRGGKPSHACHPGCVIRCSNVYHDHEGNYLTSSLEYETIGLLGANCGIGDLDAIARMDRFCDDFGIDTMETGVTMGLAMEAGLVPFGSAGGVCGLLQEMKNGSVLGRVLGQGAAVTGRVLGVRRVPAVKGQSLSAYDPRGLKGTGVTYATSPMGADHTAGNCLPGRTGFRPETSGGFPPHQDEGQDQLSRDLQVMTAVCDLAGLCFFVGVSRENMDVTAQLLGAIRGSSLTGEQVLDLGRQVLVTERTFNRLAGISEVHDDLPEWFRREPLPPHHLTFGVPREKLRKTLEFKEQ
ncbi:aldehyde:ferredoxin oxidoreductase [Clostridiales bacterium PH28_bin88]|nr:aldehyde:ferredoxin oxidoreductase [Clostridiales bacterium PH28_bin88]